MRESNTTKPSKNEQKRNSNMADSEQRMLTRSLRPRRRSCSVSYSFMERQVFPQKNK